MENYKCSINICGTAGWICKFLCLKADNILLAERLLSLCPLHLNAPSDPSKVQLVRLHLSISGLPLQDPAFLESLTECLVHCRHTLCLCLGFFIYVCIFQMSFYEWVFPVGLLKSFHHSSGNYHGSASLLFLDYHDVLNKDRALKTLLSWWFWAPGQLIQGHDMCP